MFTVSRNFETAEAAAQWLTGGKALDNLPAVDAPLTPAQKAAATRARKKAEKEAAALAKPAVAAAPVVAEVAAPAQPLTPAPAVNHPLPPQPEVAQPVAAAPQPVAVDRNGILGEVTSIVGRLLATAEKDQHTTYFTTLVRQHNPAAVKASDLGDDLLPAFLRDLQTYEASLQAAPVGQQPLV